MGDPPEASRHEESMEASPEVDPPLADVSSSPLPTKGGSSKRPSRAKPLSVNPPKESEPGDEGCASIIESLDGVTGITLRAAQVRVAECGIAMERFATDKHGASWRGVCPNNQVRAGKRVRATSGKGHRHARAI